MVDSVLRKKNTGLDLEGHEKIVEDATSVLEKYNNPIIDDKVQQLRDDKKHEPQYLLDVFVSLTDDDDAPLLSTDEIKAQVNVHLFCCEMTIDALGNSISTIARSSRL
ncbi:hypothetical protein Gotri_021340 [Gossypium trilobum]|uniref:Uncharacterized protein n=1 Tax=Gossypium trilobum TaxID=34281 RepID=A0A7J9DCL5_9ROSI|nr:hypothetical protein [Gossypium trilobum]